MICFQRECVHCVLEKDNSSTDEIDEKEEKEKKSLRRELKSRKTNNEFTDYVFSSKKVKNQYKKKQETQNKIEKRGRKKKSTSQDNSIDTNSNLNSSIANNASSSFSIGNAYSSDGEAIYIDDDDISNQNTSKKKRSSCLNVSMTKKLKKNFTNGSIRDENDTEKLNETNNDQKVHN
jgi:hypothetical protein